MAAAPELVYFNIRGRAEPIRLLLEEVGVAYTDTHAEPQWAELKRRTPFGVLPLYREGELEIAECQAILRHLARVHDLYGDDEPESARCDTFEEALVDAKRLVGMFPWRKEGEATDPEAFKATELTALLERLERFLSGNPDAPQYAVGRRLSFVDLLGFSFIDDTDGLFPGALRGFVDLQAWHRSLAERPQIARYLKSGRRAAGIQYGPHGLIHPRA